MVMCFSSSQVSIFHLQKDVLILFSCDCFFGRILTVLVIHLTNVFNMLFPCDSSFFIKKTSVTGQQLALWLLTDLLFSLFWGAYITPFWWVPLFQNSAVVPKVAQCVVPMQIRYISYIASTISGLDHCTWSPQDKSQLQFLHTSSKRKEPKHKQKAGSLLYTDTISSKHPSQNSQ